MQVLTTKLTPPTLRAQMVARPRLLAKLGDGAQRALTLVSATAGFGKTTLVSQWLTAPARPFAWLTLDDDDNAPARFFAHLISALQTLRPGLGAAALDLFQNDPLVSPETVFNALLNDIAACPSEILLVLDDYHLVTEPQIHQALTYWLDHSPSTFHLVLISRVDPPLPLARWRVRNWLVELRASDLVFTPEEAAEFLNTVCQLDLSPAQILALEQRTEGWIAGLQLAALALQVPLSRANVDEFIENFAGNDRYVFDYLAQEVIQQQDDRTRNFLLETSLLDRLCAGLCQAVTGLADAQVVLERLERENLFTVALDHERAWYRYHHLFAEFLRHILRQTQPARIPELHRRAAAWCETHELCEQAIEHWLAAGDYERAAELIEQQLASRLEHTRARRGLGWLERLPAVVRDAHPRLALAELWSLLLTGQFERAEQQLPAVAARLQDPVEIAQIDALRSLFVGLRGDRARGLELAQQAYAKPASDDPFARGLNALNLGTAYLFNGQLEMARRILDDAYTLQRSVGNDTLAVVAATTRADVDALRGELERAAASHQGLLEELERKGKADLPFAHAARVGLADIEREWNWLAQAQARLQPALLDSSDTFAPVHAFLVAARIACALHDYDRSQEMLDRAAAAARRFPLPFFVAQIAAQQGELMLARGHLDAAARWAETRRLGESDELDLTREFEYIVFAQLRLAQERTAAALELSRRIAAAAESGGRIPHLILAEALMALVQARRGESDVAQVTLHRALERAEPEGYIRSFANYGAPMRELLLSLHATLDSRNGNAALAAYINRLLDAIPAAVSETLLAAAPLDPLLSEREREILVLLAQGLSNNDIAGRLVLTPGTVKWHVNNIYTKLDVHNRTQAAARAREIKLLA